MHDMIWAFVVIVTAMLFYRYVLPRLKNFDDRNVARIARDQRDAQDPNAHIRHALEMAEEQVEQVQVIRTGDVTHYVFEAEAFATRDAAEERRAMRIGAIARRFYEDLPGALAGRPEKRGNLSARERASQRWRGRE